MVLLIPIICMGASYANTKINYPLQGKVIFIDPGHGSKDAGTIYNDIYEKNINLQISNYLKLLLTQNGAIVYLTRIDDYDLSSPLSSRRKKSDFDNRISMINNSNADLYLSIHINYLDDSNYSGPQVFYNKNNEAMASVYQKILNDKLSNNRTYKHMDQNYYMYKRLNKPGLLIECGFISNAQERKKLIDAEYQKKVASALKEATIVYFKTQNSSFFAQS